MEEAHSVYNYPVAYFDKFAAQETESTLLAYTADLCDLSAKIRSTISEDKDCFETPSVSIHRSDGEGCKRGEETKYQPQCSQSLC